MGHQIRLVVNELADDSGRRSQRALTKGMRGRPEKELQRGQALLAVDHRARLEGVGREVDGLEHDGAHEVGAAGKRSRR